MDEDNSSQPRYLAAIWLVLGLYIFLTNLFSSYVLWLTKGTREKAELGRHIHSLWNQICTNIAFSLVGLSLFLTAAILLASNSFSDRLCGFITFVHAFSFNFAAFGILVQLIDKAYNFLKPFEYRFYCRVESRVPLAIFVCSTLYAIFIAVLPLTTLGTYYQLKYTSICMMKWEHKRAPLVTVCFSLILQVTTIAFIIFDVQQVWKLYRSRRRLKVPFIRHKETQIFMLVLTSLFSICWCPYIIAMLVSVIPSGGHPGEVGIAVLFGITLVPLLVSPVLTYFLHGHYQEECKKLLGDLNKYFIYFMSKKNPSTTG
ncbi:tachykinin-like peptides receptor 86C [Dendronephthya gigantea]|uniref:tachykinin-like peptides receptor 86C n=1 Tax=Dendronephthya gigantea TaxID=151771 RepID=UPI00106AD4F5|nr:tachykinin-like peptides receptor 86C [Dendronephthya gigantea]